LAGAIAVARAPLPGHPTYTPQRNKGLRPDHRLGFRNLPAARTRTLYAENPTGYHDQLPSARWLWTFHVYDPFGSAELITHGDSVLSVRIHRLRASEGWRLLLEQAPLAIRSGDHYRLSLRVRAAAPRRFAVALAERQPPWNHRGLYLQTDADAGWRTIDTTFIATASDTNARLYFELGNDPVSIDLANVQLLNVSTDTQIRAPAPAEYATIYDLNRLGCRGRDYPERRESGTWRVVVLGDSYAFGEGLREQDTFAALTERFLTDSTGTRRRFEVINCGVPDYSVRQMRQLFEQRLRRYRADVLVVMIRSDNPLDAADLAEEVSRLVTSTDRDRMGLVVATGGDTTTDRWRALRRAVSSTPHSSTVSLLDVSLAGLDQSIAPSDELSGLLREQHSTALHLGRHLAHRCERECR
jgi:hypothetical protein